MSLFIDLLIKNSELKIKIIHLQAFYEGKYPDYPQSKINKLITFRLKKETEELNQLNINPCIEALNS